MFPRGNDNVDHNEADYDDNNDGEDNNDDDDYRKDCHILTDVLQVIKSKNII